jgi:glutamyl-tRNA synthetase
MVHEDVVFGRTVFPADPSAEDPVLLKQDGWPTYHLSSVIDDHLMGITHVLRGEEWLPSVPKHLALYEALGWEPPKLGHLALLMNEDGSKLSKRSGHASVQDYQRLGYEPEALVNFIALIGYNHHRGSEEAKESEHHESEVMTIDDLIRNVSFHRLPYASFARLIRTSLLSRSSISLACHNLARR